MANYTVVVTVNVPSRGSASGGGTFVDGTAVEIEASPNAGYNFAGWSDGNVELQRTIIVRSNITLTAFFLAEGECAVSINYDSAQGSVNINNANPPVSAGTFLEGESVLVTAVPLGGYVFDGWYELDGSQITTATSYAFTVGTTNRLLLAQFRVSVVTYDVVVGVNNSTMGRVDVAGATGAPTVDSAGRAHYTTAENQQVTLSAVANTGYRLAYWNVGGTTVTDNPYIFIAANKVVDAVFEISPIIPVETTVIDLLSNTGIIETNLSGKIRGTYHATTLSNPTYTFYWSQAPFDPTLGTTSSVFEWVPSGATGTGFDFELPIIQTFETLSANTTSLVIYLGVVGRSSEAINYQSNIPLTLNVAAGYKPTISLSALSFTNTYNNLPVAGYSRYSTTYVLGKTPSNNSATSSGTGITSQASRGGCNVSGNAIVGSLVSSPTSYSFVVSATVRDSRDRTSDLASTTSVSVEGYYLPRFTLLDVDHCDEHGVTHGEGESDQNTYCRVEFSLDVAALSDNEVDPTTINFTINNRTYVGCSTTSQGYLAIIGGGELDPTTNYTINITVHDKVMQALAILSEVFSINLSTKWPLSLLDDKAGKVGMAVGTEATQDNVFEVALDTNFAGDPLLVGNRVSEGVAKSAFISSYDLIHNAVRIYEEDNDSEGTYGNRIRIATGAQYKDWKDRGLLDAHTIYFLSDPVTGV